MEEGKSIAPNCFGRTSLKALDPIKSASAGPSGHWRETAVFWFGSNKATSVNHLRIVPTAYSPSEVSGPERDAQCLPPRSVPSKKRKAGNKRVIAGTVSIPGGALSFQFFLTVTLEGWV